MVRFLSLLAVCAAVAVTAGPSQAAETRQISVTGQGEVTATPDMATVTVGVTHIDRDAGAAMAEVSAGVGRILERLTEMGVEDRDMQTRQLTLNPVWSGRTSSGDGETEITGFAASNLVMVRIRDLERMGDILQAVLGDGANEFRGLQFGLQDPGPLAEAARRAAVEDAVSRARVLAEAAGVPLGPVQSISEHGGAPRPQMMEMASARGGGGMPVAGGEVGVEVSVSMVFAIGE